MSSEKKETLTPNDSNTGTHQPADRKSPNPPGTSTKNPSGGNTGSGTGSGGSGGGDGGAGQ